MIVIPKSLRLCFILHVYTVGYFKSFISSDEEKKTRWDDTTRTIHLRNRIRCTFHVQHGIFSIFCLLSSCNNQNRSIVILFFITFVNRPLFYFSFFNLLICSTKNLCSECWTNSEKTRYKNIINSTLSSMSTVRKFFYSIKKYSNHWIYWINLSH